MIHADPIERALPQPAQNQRVRVGEHLRIFDAQPDQRIDVEEAAIDQFLFRRLPVGEPVILLFEDGVQPVYVVVDRFQCAVHGLGNERSFVEKPLQQIRDDALVPMTFGDACPIRQRGVRKPRERIGKERQVIRPGSRAAALPDIDGSERGDAGNS